MLYRIYRFLGSLPFALFLLASTALVVITGTVLESVTGSHQFAAKYTYSHPLFTLLLVGYFINILLSALRRFPFRKDHIPFLITHLGLLCILAGVIAKNLFGLQGHLLLTEGTSSDQLIVKEIEALLVETRNDRWMLPLHQLPIRLPGLTLAITEYSPHTEIHYNQWIHGNQLHVFGHPPNSENLIIMDNQEIAFNKLENGDIEISTAYGNELYPHDQLKTLYIYDDGFSGYSTSFQLTENPDLIIEKMVMESFENQLSEGIELSPPLERFQDAAQDQFTSLLPDLLAKRRTPELLATLDKVLLHPYEQTASYWAAILLEKLDTLPTAPFREKLKQIEWPLPPQETEIDFLQQLFEMASTLPPPPTSIIDRVSLLNAYFRTFGISYEVVFSVSDRNQLIAQYNNRKNSIKELLTPVTPGFKSLPPLTKMEDNMPGILLAIQEKNRRYQLPLSFDRLAQGVKWPSADGNYRFRFQPMTKKIPYRVRLHEARQINYPFSDQPYSYEAAIWINGEKKELSMNHVHETWDGYRFYLSNIITPAGNRAKQVRIVVNHDPAKWLLTYPGALMLSLGIILLFWKRKKVSSS